jgi:hypothetical protein
MDGSCPIGEPPLEPVRDGVRLRYVVDASAWPPMTEPPVVAWSIKR